MEKVLNCIEKGRLGLDSADFLNWLRLIRSENIGPKNFFMVMEMCSDTTAALALAAELSIRGGRKKPIKIFSKQDAILEMENIRKFWRRICYLR